MRPRLRSLLFQAGSFALAGALLYLALRGVNLARLGEVLRDADYVWLVPLGLVAVASHVLRAWRWQVLLGALPEARRVSLWDAFGAVMIGYMVNYAAPRLGEVARSAHLSARRKLPLSGVLGTVVAERVLDVACLAVALGATGLLLLDRAPVLERVFLGPARESLGGSWLLLLLAALLAALAAGAAVFVWRQARDAEGAPGWRGRVAPVLVSFRSGMLSLLRSRRRGVLIATTLAMWACYATMAYLPLLMLGIAEPYGLGLVDGWNLMVIGTLGILVPSPGGVGSYHFVTIQALVHLFGVPEDPAAAYAVLTHAAQLVLYVALGALCLMLQGLHFSGRLRLSDSGAAASPPTPDADTPS